MGNSQNDKVFVAVDFETANRFRGSICEIGLAKFDAHGLIDSFTSLVRPREDFDEFEYTAIHGITPEDVSSSPTIDQIWPEIWSFIDGHLLVAHNASFDMGALFDISGYLGLEIPETEYFCTLVMARRILNLPSNRLADLADYFDLKQNEAHRAGDDARVAGELALSLMSVAEVDWFDHLETRFQIAAGFLSTKMNVGSKKITELSDHTTSLPRYTPRKRDDSTVVTPDLSLPVARELLLSWINLLPEGVFNISGVFHGHEVYFHNTESEFTPWEGQQLVAMEGGFSSTKITKFTTLIVCSNSEKIQFLDKGLQALTPSEFLSISPRSTAEIPDIPKPPRPPEVGYVFKL